MRKSRVINTTKSNCVAESCMMARSFWARGKGLLGTPSLGAADAMWIARCNSIHTFFMRYAIDCVFVDKNFVVKQIHHNVKPWRWVPPVWGAHSVFEMAAGQAEAKQIDVGDKLDVVH